MRILAAALTTVVVAASTVDLKAQDTIAWVNPTVGGWSIAVDTTLGNGCFIWTEFEGNASARIGFDLTSDNAYLVVGDLDWASIEAGKDYPIELQMGNKPSWTANALGGRMGDVPTLMLTSTDPAFVDEFSSQRNIRVWFNNNEIMNLSLSGTSAAVAEMLRCQDEINQTNAGTADPFASGGGAGKTVSDPFAN